MRARVVVFPLEGRRWCFSRSLAARSPASPNSSSSSSWRDLWTRITSGGRPAADNAEIIVDFLADKMNRAWVGLETAPRGTLKNRMHSLGLRLLSRVKPSEVFLKSVTKDVTALDITYPADLNPRLVRRRLRHIAMRGTALHRKYLYGSVFLLPFTAAFSVLPLPNIPFFWILFRTYSNWRALQGSQRLLLLVSDCPSSSTTLRSNNGNEFREESKHATNSAPDSPLVLKPSEDLEKFLADEDPEDGVRNDTIANICRAYNLNKTDVLKYHNSF